jgi:lysylphosphatidylglycerol synthetase-like protein (DUF2156 family)
MEDKEILNLWKLQDAKLEHALAINMQLLTEVKQHKAQTTLQKLVSFKRRGIVAAIIYLALLGMMLAFAIAHYSAAANYFIISIGLIFIINIKALSDYIRHLVWVNDINYDGSVVQIQQNLAKLQMSIISHNRIMVLQFPLWTTFYLSSKWFPQDVGWIYIVFQTALTASFTLLAIWLYKNQIPENADKRWFKMFYNGSGGKSVTQALIYYNEIEDFKKE